MLSWVDTLTNEYAKGKSELVKYRDKIDRKAAHGKMELLTVNGMISDMQYALEWMRRGRRPGSYRGIEDRQVYNRRVLLNMDHFPSLDLDVQSENISDAQKTKLVEILLKLSERERQCYILHMAYGFTMTEISIELVLTKRTVQTFIDRAKAKIQKFTA